MAMRLLVTVIWIEYEVVLAIMYLLDIVSISVVEQSIC